MIAEYIKKSDVTAILVEEWEKLVVPGTELYLNIMPILIRVGEMHGIIVSKIRSKTIIELKDDFK